VRESRRGQEKKEGRRGGREGRRTGEAKEGAMAIMRGCVRSGRRSEEAEAGEDL
jgi:hypothetical protein